MKGASSSSRNPQSSSSATAPSSRDEIRDLEGASPSKQDLEAAMDHEDHAEVEQGVWQEVPDKPRVIIRLPSRQEQERHWRTRIPYRAWCEWCVRGRKPNLRHQPSAREHEGQAVHMDYCFFRARPGAPAAPCLVLRDRLSRAIGAHIVPMKGAAMEWVVIQALRDIQKWGIPPTASLLLRSDQEPAIVDLMEEIAKRRARGCARPGKTTLAFPSKGLGRKWLH